MKHIDAFRLGDAFHTEDGEATFTVIAEDGEAITVTLRPSLVPKLGELLLRAEEAHHRSKFERRGMN
jgi:hypothetical protein